jgi:Uncharacterized conserved protein
MATIKSFHGIRYNARELTKLICPPYDIISQKEKAALKKRSNHNMVRLELPDASGARNKYLESGRLFREWLDKGVLAKEAAPALYFYEQRFTDHGRKMVRRGFFAALKLENPHGGAVKPHERTLAKPKEDRLKLLRAVRANLSPIFGLFHDKGLGTLKYAKKLSATRPAAEAKDDEGTLHRLWVVSGEKDISRIAKSLASEKIFIADGHHRYETAWNYLQERKKKGGKFSPTAGYNYVMAFLCPMEDPGLSIWPTHRVVEAPADLEEKIEKYFKVLPAGAFAKLSKHAPQPLLVYAGGTSRTLIVKDVKTLASSMPDKCKAYRDLGVSILHSLLFAGVPPENITYVKDEREAKKLADSSKRIAVMVPATPVEAVRRIALANQTMPQKSTYFYPKVASGIVIHVV